MAKLTIAVRQATVADLDHVVPLFDSYRQFYGKTTDLGLARAFLLERFQYEQSIIFIALDQDGRVVGFTQLYPAFSSVSAARVFILNDLFVVPAARRRGVASALLRTAADFGRANGAVRLTLSTAITNESAQALYEAEGWSRDTSFYVYHLPLTT
jgi:GNAT superfamily N-acetyltransferase